MSSFKAEKLASIFEQVHTLSMGGSSRSPQPYTVSVRQRIEKGGERLWRLDDFRDLPFTAVAQALSRLTRAGTLERLSKGIYYKTRPTAFGHSRPNPSAIQKLASKHNPVFPAGLAAANMLGFTSQTGSRSEISTTALSLPRKLVGEDTVINTRRLRHGILSRRKTPRFSNSSGAEVRPANCHQSKPSTSCLPCPARRGGLNAC